MEPYSHEKHKQHAFDSFCKKVLRNEVFDFFNEHNRQRQREVSLTYLPEQEFEMLLVTDEYPIEKFIFSVLDFDVEIQDERVAEAIAALPEEKRDIILLYYFLGMTDGEIGQKMNIIPSSVQYKRTSTLQKLKIIMEGTAVE